MYYLFFAETIIGEEPVEQKVTASKPPSSTATATKTDRRKTSLKTVRTRDSKLIKITAFICGGLVVAVLIGATTFAVIERYELFSMHTLYVKNVI